MYEIKSARAVQTKYGRRVVVCINNFETFLPARFHDLSEDEIKDLCNFGIKNITNPEDKFTKVEFTR